MPANEYFPELGDAVQAVDAAAPEVVAAATEEYFPGLELQSQPGDPNIPTEEQPGFVERTIKTLGETGGSMVDKVLGLNQEDENFDTSNIDPATLEAFGAPEHSAARQAQQVLSDGVSAVSNVLVDGGLSAVQAIVPDEWQEDIVDFGRGKWERLMGVPAAAAGVEALKEGAEVYQAWAKENPDTAERLSEVLNISAILKPVKVATRGKPLRRKGVNQDVSNRKAKTENMLEPIGRKGGGELVYDKNGKVRYKGDAWEQGMADEVMRVPDVKPGRSYIYNRDKVRLQAHKERLKLEESINRKGNPQVDTKKAKTQLANRINKMGDETLLTGEAREKAILIYNHAQRFIDESDGTAIGMLQARRNLDAFMAKNKPDVFDGDRESAMKIAMREVRNSINDSIEKTVGPSYRKSLDKQHKLLSAGDLLDAKGMKEASTRMGRFKQKFEDTLGMKIPTTPLALGATGAAGVALMAAYPTIGALMATGAGVVGLTKALRGPQAKIIMGELMNMTEKYPMLGPEINMLVQGSEALKAEDDDA